MVNGSPFGPFQKGPRTANVHAVIMTVVATCDCGAGPMTIPVLLGIQTGFTCSQCQKSWAVRKLTFERDPERDDVPDKVHVDLHAATPAIFRPGARG